MFKLAKQAVSIFLDLCFPRSCLGCQILLGKSSRNHYFCPNCEMDLYIIHKPFCPVLGTAMPHQIPHGSISFQALMSPPPFRCARAAFQHNGLAKKLVTKLKFHDQLHLVPILANYMIKAGNELITDCDIIIPIPLHYTRFWHRRYNQSTLLAKYIAKSYKKPISINILYRTVKTAPQTSLNKKLREKNLKNAFKCHPGKSQLIKNKKILLIDDVLTTGSTVKEATKTLILAGAKRVDILTITNSYNYKI